ncbi:PREDICTED: RNA polymerase II C-terminal domain phosphatase-like 3 [Tarenaya hassleriana]|uniref:RNA polymerase II C-terminal domain phosphatase-like 3 n=1 Tax=Tarenaya hassleriana TaxID=28532 RepID=UPI00053C58AD|nr:PREDICTED: RNA polymerase II C-terminal domain phosphatase-like 3 [Tarenaya hassleriana]
MLVAGSDCSRTLIGMGKDDESVVMVDVEEGEISDAASVEEITGDDFSRLEEKPSQAAASGGDSAGGRGGSNGGNPRVWTMHDLLTKYPGFRGYSASGLYNFAWAQAVQNKSLNEALRMEIEPSENGNGKGSSQGKSKEGDRLVIEDSDDEKEQGELEEGEIDLESVSDDELGDFGSQAEAESDISLPADSDGTQIGTKAEDLEKKVKLIRGVLESTSLVEAHTAFEGVSSRLFGAMESLRDLISENDDFPKRDTLVQLSFAALETVNSVFCSMDNMPKELNKETMSRLLSLVKSHFSRFLSSNQIKEIESMIQSLSCSHGVLYAGSDYKEKEGMAIGGIAQKSNGVMAADFGCPIPSMNANNISSEASKRGTSNLRSRAPLLPLLDLHKDHDIDSLPSPTREPTPSLPSNRPHPFHFTVVKLGTPVGKVHPYESDAIKAVSSYQQKFGRNSFFRTYDDLPSPTPSEESNNGNGDICGEVSSSVVHSSKPGRLVIPGHDVPLPSSLNIRNHLPNNTSDPTAKPSAKSRDPRLRFAKLDGSALPSANQNSSSSVGNKPRVESSGGFISSRKVKAGDVPLINGPAWKRRKNGFESHEGVKDLAKAAGTSGWLEETDSSRVNPIPRTMENGATTSMAMARSFTPSNGVSMTSVTNTSTGSLPSLLKDIVAVNPTMLLNLLKMGERQREVTESSTPQKPTDPRRAAQLPGSFVPPVRSPNLSKPAGVIQDSSQSAPSDESGSIRMKPRDPRRILHGNTLQKTGSLVENRFKVSEPSTSGTIAVKDKADESFEIKPAASQFVQQQDTSQKVTSNMNNPGVLLNGKEPDISTQFTKNLKNVAEVVAVSQFSNPPVKTEKDKDVRQRGVSASATAATGPACSLNNWEVVEHLFEGYDDKQRAAIQRERSRRLEEQKKMFASQKLCLVLDLDHTLLNSAKFNEVDPIHDEILRKKEEQDREKPCRHLFRFPHMGMWTKLRPGVWNFLEKASKLYELHLYTMGNKLYATEMAKVLDPKGVLFNGRVISRGDDGDPFDGEDRVPKSKDLEGVLGMESAVVIIDDSVRVWPHNKMNLIVVERYTYFPCSRRQFGLLGPSLLEIDHDERPEDGTLASSLAVIERIHRNFFSHPSLDEADVRNILAAEQRNILAGCRIVFSRVFPVGEANPHLHPLWQTAEQFGAVCATQIDDHVTHVVANSLGTDKVNWGLSTGRFVVHPGWVEASALLYRRANEHDFAIKP